MDKAQLVEKLNYAISLELCAAIQYYQNAEMLMGADRRLWRDVFKDMSEGAFEDARKFGFYVSALGGVPNVEPAPIRQAAGATEMLNNALELEQKLVDAYTDALSISSDSPAYRNLLEDQILHETDDVYQLEKYLGRTQKLPGAQPVQQATRTA